MAIEPRIIRCDHCGAETGHTFSNYCGAWVCDVCGTHAGLSSCYCGWAASGGDGRAELIEAGETIDGDDGNPYGYF